MNRNKLFTSLLLLSLGALCACRQQDSVAGAISLFTAKLHAVETSEPLLWPGLNYDAVPLIVRFGEQGAIFAGKNKDGCGFRQIRDFVPIFTQSQANIYFKPGSFGVWMRAEFSLNFMSCEGVTYLGDYKAEQDMLFQDNMFHEYFHSYQNQYFKWSDKNLGRPAHMLPEQAALAYIEENLLAKALLADDDWKTYAASFTALRIYRKQLPDPFSFNRWEDEQEAIEGTARYFETRTKAFNYKTRTFMPPPLTHVASVLLGQEFDTWSMIQSRQYATGNAQGLLLDRAGVDWKIPVQNGTPLFSIFAAAFPESKDSAALVAAMKSEYDYNGLLSIARAYFVRNELRYPVGRYTAKLVIESCANPVVKIKPLLDAPANYRLDDGTNARPFEELLIATKDSFNIKILRGCSLSVTNEPPTTTGKSCKKYEILTMHPLDDLSIDTAKCVPADGQLRCDNLTLSNYFIDAHFNTPVRFGEESEIITVDGR